MITMSPERYVIWIPEPGDQTWPLPGVIPSGWGFGGRRTMHELAVAIAASGRRVELRGDVDVDELRVLAEAAGAMPELPTEPRGLDRGDVVILTEGSDDPITFARAALSPARAIVMLLGPPGLIGWPFTAGWLRPSPLTVSLDAVAQPEHFRAMAGMGLELWTHMPRMAERAEAAGVPCAFIGKGRPLPYPEPLPKRYDVVTMAANRWAPWAKEVTARLDGGVTHHEIAGATNAEVLEQLGQARVLIHPLRIEGDSRLGREARAMGAVPVVLDSSPFGVGLDEQGGAVTVASVEEMPTAVMVLLRDQARLRELAERGMRSARAEVDWSAFVARVEEALRRPAPRDPSRDARAAIGRRVMEREAAAHARLESEREVAVEQLRGEARATLERVEAEHEQSVREHKATVEQMHAEMHTALAGAEAERDRLERELDTTAERLRTAQATNQAITSTRAWRLVQAYWRTRAYARHIATHFKGRNGDS
jgi:glycosyltransferase involved in cell wall biosynthesis